MRHKEHLGCVFMLIEGLQIARPQQPANINVKINNWRVHERRSLEFSGLLVTMQEPSAPVLGQINHVFSVYY